MPRSIAAALTGDGVTFCPRPRGRSGCVTTAATLYRDDASAVSEGTANAGVPKKTTSMALPLAGALQLSNATRDHVALQAAQPVEKQQSVEVVDFVMEGAREQSRRVVHAGLT